MQNRDFQTSNEELLDNYFRSLKEEMGNLGSCDDASSMHDSELQSDVDENWPWVFSIRDPTCLDWKKSANGKTLGDEEIKSIQKIQNNHPIEILPYLYLSNAVGAHDCVALEALKITHILNMAGICARGPSVEYARAGIIVKEIATDDEEGYPILEKTLDEARAFIAKAREVGGKCVVHCVAGINRSGFIVAAETLLSTRQDVLHVVKYLRLKRGNIFLSNESFQEQLVLLARREGLLGPSQGEPGSLIPDYVPPKKGILQSSSIFQKRNRFLAGI